jgi:mannose-6-phosphate isomerase
MRPKTHKREQKESDSMFSENRPWGAFHVLEEQAGFKVKRLSVTPGGRLSLQSHKHRWEHWTVVNGTATVTVDDAVLTLERGQSVDIPLGARHRLENLYATTVDIIEVQFGDYLGEDDIIRYDDIYNRT